MKFYDAIVVDGGLAGVAAAISAAREGVKKPVTLQFLKQRRELKNQLMIVCCLCV